MKVFTLLSILLLSLQLIAQSVDVVKFPELQKQMATTDAPLTVFNFWATWCGPCVKEMPHFEKYANNRNVDIVFVSMDFIQDLEKVERFVDKKNLNSKVLLLNETDYGSFMSKVSEEWSGAIPATLFVDEWGKTYFHEKEFSEKELDNTIKKYLN